jgi:CRP/FNR family cyclic AMP-dependent transcriptional regulator
MPRILTLLGWSWLLPPHTWSFGAVAASPVEAFEFDGRAVRAGCETDPVLGYGAHQAAGTGGRQEATATRIRMTSSP